MTPAIRVVDLAKRYAIDPARPRYRTLRAELASAAAAPLRWLRRERAAGSLAAADAPDEVWALRGVSFEVPEGQAVGLIGHNGAGKTTLLRLLSRITDPTRGEAFLHGRVASLLDVGLGFHGELTGRQNVLLGGAILGLRREEVARKLDAIVAFAGVERFLDTPVRQYSAGMHARLAFSVAAHLEPDILLVDEVLATGDAEFQRRCLGRLGEVARDGRTVLFVSHNLGAVETLCQRALVLERGRLTFDGPARDAVAHYLAGVRGQAAVPLERCARRGSGALRLVSFDVEGADGQPRALVKSGDDVTFVAGFERGPVPVDRPSLQVLVHAEDERLLAVLGSAATGAVWERLPERGAFRCRVPRLPLAPGRYLVRLRAQAGWDLADEPDVALPLEVAPGDFHGSGAPVDAWTRAPLLVETRWECAER